MSTGDSRMNSVQLIRKWRGSKHSWTRSTKSARPVFSSLPPLTYHPEMFQSLNRCLESPRIDYEPRSQLLHLHTPARRPPTPSPTLHAHPTLHRGKRRPRSNHPSHRFRALHNPLSRPSRRPRSRSVPYRQIRARHSNPRNLCNQRGGSATAFV